MIFVNFLFFLSVFGNLASIRSVTWQCLHRKFGGQQWLYSRYLEAFFVLRPSSDLSITPDRFKTLALFIKSSRDLPVKGGPPVHGR